MANVSLIPIYIRLSCQSRLSNKKQVNCHKQLCRQLYVLFCVRFRVEDKNKEKCAISGLGTQRALSSLHYGSDAGKCAT